MSQRGNKLLLGLLVMFLLLFGADRLASSRRLTPEEKYMEQRARVLSTWKPAFENGSTAPDFTLRDARGRPHSLKDFRGYPVLLSFYTDDRRSRVWAREMLKLRNYLGRSRIRSIAVVSFSPERVKEFIRDTKDDSLYLFEKPDRHPVRDQYKAAPGPNSWVVDRRGHIRHASPPILTDQNPDKDFNDVHHALRALAPRPLPPSDLPEWARGTQRPPADGG